MARVMTTLRCAWCQRDFERALSRVVQGEDRFCSVRCTGLARRKREPIEHDGDIFYQNFRDGYFISLRTRRFLHRVIWEAAHGPVPPGHVVHHIDEDKTNNDPGNLLLMAKGDHCRLHKPGQFTPRTRSHGPCLWPGCDAYGCSRGYCRRCYERACHAGILERGPARKKAHCDTPRGAP